MACNRGITGLRRCDHRIEQRRAPAPYDGRINDDTAVLCPAVPFSTRSIWTGSIMADGHRLNQNDSSIIDRGRPRTASGVTTVIRCYHWPAYQRCHKVIASQPATSKRQHRRSVVLQRDARRVYYHGQTIRPSDPQHAVKGPTARRVNRLRHDSFPCQYHQHTRQ